MRRFWVPLVACLGIFSIAVGMSTISGHFLAFATWDSLFMGIGKYEPGQGWKEYQQFNFYSDPGDVFTLYTMAGEVAQVTDMDPYHHEPRRIPVEWSAQISPWYNKGMGEPYALAIPGRSPLAAEPAKALPLDSPELVERVSAYLSKRKLSVPHPYLTQAFEVSISPGVPKAILLCAHSDASKFTDSGPAAVYALALLEVPENGTWKDYPLVQQTSYKPEDRSVDEHERRFGKRNFYRFLACLDIDSDGWKEMVLYTAEPGYGTQIDVFSFDGRRIKNKVSAFKHLFN